MISQRPHWPFQTKLVVSLLVLAFFVYLTFRFSAAIPPIILAIILANIISPLVTRLQGLLRVRRGLATLIAYLILLLFVIVVPVAIFPPLATQIDLLNLDTQLVLEQLKLGLSHDFRLFGLVIDGNSLVEQLSDSFQGLAQPFIGQSLVFLVDVITSVVWVVFILVISFYLIKDAPALRVWMEGLPPPEYREDFVRLRDEINLIWGSFFRGQLVLALVVAVIFTAAGFLLGLPFALALGILAGFLEFLPSVGHGIWIVIASILAFFLGSTWLPLPNWIFMLLVIGLHTGFTQFDLNYLIPRIIGRRVHLPPLVVILGIVAGAVTAGILGIPLAAPTIASARVIGRYIYANLFDLDPFPAQPALPPAPLFHPPAWWRAWRRAG